MPFDEAEGPPSSSLLRHPPFVFFWVARICSSLAFQMQSVAIGWKGYALTGSAFDLGLVGLAEFLPIAVLTLAVGHAADRYNRRRIVAACQMVEAVVAVLLTVGVATGSL